MNRHASEPCVELRRLRAVWRSGRGPAADRSRGLAAPRGVVVAVGPDPVEAEVAEQKDNRKLNTRHEAPSDHDIAPFSRECVEFPAEAGLTAAEEAIRVSASSKSRCSNPC
jgi:hypothetical protein